MMDSWCLYSSFSLHIMPVLTNLRFFIAFDSNGWIDSLKRTKLIMATNRPYTLDPALIRPGRLDRRIEVSKNHDYLPVSSTSTVTTSQRSNFLSLKFFNSSFRVSSNDFPMILPLISKVGNFKQVTYFFTRIFPYLIKSPA